MLHLGIFGLEFYKKYGYIWNQCSLICLIAKGDAKIKIFKRGTKNALFGYFLAVIF